MNILNPGCSPRSRKEGSVGLDKRPAPHVDVVHDLNDYPYPFPDSEFDWIEMSHIIEHVDRPMQLMEDVAPDCQKLSDRSDHHAVLLVPAVLRRPRTLPSLRLRHVQRTSEHRAFRDPVTQTAFHGPLPGPGNRFSREPLSTQVGKIPRLHLFGDVRGGRNAGHGKTHCRPAHGRTHVLRYALERILDFLSALRILFL